MNFGEAVNAVLEETKRQDKLSIIRREVNAALAFFVTDINGNRDSEEQLVAIDPVEYTQEFALSSLTRFRKFQYIKLGGTKAFIMPITLPEVASGCADMRNRYYIMGSSVKLSLAGTGNPNLDVCYWQHAPELTGTETHWLLDSYPYPIINRAASRVFAGTGDKDEAARFKAYSDEEWRNKRNDLAAEGTQ